MILIVDDRPENILPLKKILELHDFKTDSATSGEEALKKILKHTYSLIILDVQMPDMDGFEVAETIAGFSKVKHTPILFLSAVNKEKKFIEKGFESGAVDYLTKPVDPDILIMKVRTFIRLFEQTQELQRVQKSLEKEIEERKKMQDALAEVNTSLEDKVNSRTSELQEKNQELESINFELQQFGWVVSHDLMEPLRKIQTFNTIIRDKFLHNNPEATDYINRSIKASQRMNSLVSDLLDYSRLSKEQLFEPTDFNHMISELKGDLESLIEEKNAEIEVCEFPVIEAIPGQVRLVFQNLLHNALKFSVPGRQPKIRIICERVKEKTAESEKDEKGRFLKVSVQDNGIGFDEKFLDRIFVIFQRLHSHKEFPGTGIGLAIVHKIISKHNGIITAKSQEGKGSTFIIVLPIKQTCV